MIQRQLPKTALILNLSQQEGRILRVNKGKSNDSIDTLKHGNNTRLQ